MAVVSITSPIMHNFRIFFLRFYRPLDSFLSIRLFRLRRLALPVEPAILLHSKRTGGQRRALRAVPTRTEQLASAGATVRCVDFI
jgi:hypothetical protein